MAYQPPQAELFAQIVDVIVLVVLTVGALYVPLYLGLAGAAKTPKPIENPTWEALGQNAVEQQQWAALGITDPAAANDIITARFDYTFSWTALIVMAVLVVGYFVLVVRLSDKEYREVIDERFGEDVGAASWNLEYPRIRRLGPLGVFALVHASTTSCRSIRPMTTTC